MLIAVVEYLEGLYRSLTLLEDWLYLEIALEGDVERIVLLIRLSLIDLPVVKLVALLRIYLEGKLCAFL